MSEAAREEYLTIEQFAERLGWTEKTVRNKMTGRDAIFKRGVHYDSPPGLPTLFRWSAVLEMYHFGAERPQPPAAAGVRLHRDKERC